jgi:hypothetical protein
MEQAKTMKRSLLAAALLAATATTALAASTTNETPAATTPAVTLRTAGLWTSWYSPANSEGQPMCGMGQKIHDYPTGANGSFVVKYAPGYDVFVQVFKSGWNIPENARIPISLQFDRVTPLTMTASGRRTAAGSSYVNFEIKPDFVTDFLAMFANADAMTLAFTERSEKPWSLNMSGAREAIEAFTRCRYSLPARGTPQPSSNSGATQPYGATPAKPSQPFGPQPTSPAPGGSGAT